MERSRLLLAEDDEALASLLEEYLQEANYDVVVHRRGDTALAALKREHFDLVLTDIVMPGGDGLSLLRYVHDSEADTLVMLMTGYSGIEDALHAVEQGAYDFVSKPFQLPEIQVRLDNAARFQKLLRRFNKLAGVSVENETAPTLKVVSGPSVARAYGEYMNERSTGQQ